MDNTKSARDPLAYRNERATTWADGFGVWHVRIDFPAPGYDPDELRGHIDRLRRKAGRAIRAELTVRSELGPGWKVRLVPAGKAQTADGVTQSVTFRERTP